MIDRSSRFAVDVEKAVINHLDEIISNTGYLNNIKIFLQSINED